MDASDNVERAYSTPQMITDATNGIQLLNGSRSWNWLSHSHLGSAIFEAIRVSKLGECGCPFRVRNLIKTFIILMGDLGRFVC